MFLMNSSKALSLPFVPLAALLGDLGAAAVRLLRSSLLAGHNSTTVTAAFSVPLC